MYEDNIMIVLKEISWNTGNSVCLVLDVGQDIAG
jgi:hypothetical protein